jgi:regulator of protease activity HflC (stomatin/prohibitin superfamily)
VAPRAARRGPARSRHALGRAQVLRATAEALELPDDVVPSDDDLEAQMKAAADAEAEKMAALQKAEADKMILENKLEMDKEAAIAAREDQAKSADLLADVVKQAVANAMKMHAEQRKKVAFKYDDKGVLVGGETE